MVHRTDPFPSRLKQPEDPFMRSDPVVYSRNQHRWEGSLDEVSLSRYERDGFLWFEGFFNQERMMSFFDELIEMAKDEKLNKSEKIISDPNSGEIRSVFGMHELSENFSRLTRGLRMRAVSASLMLTDKNEFNGPLMPTPGSLLLFECNTLHASNKNMSPWLRSNLFFVYNSVENR